MQIRDMFEALGKQVRSLTRSWKIANATEPSCDHIPETERSFFQLRYDDFIERARRGEALEIHHFRDEATFDGDGTSEGQSILLTADIELPKPDFSMKTEPNHEFLRDFKGFLFGYGYSYEDRERAALYAQRLSYEGVRNNRARYAEIRARHAAMRAPELHQPE